MIKLNDFIKIKYNIYILKNILFIKTFVYCCLHCEKVK